MLVLDRKVGERIHIGQGIVLTVLEIGGGRTRLGLEAPAGTRIRRGEVPFDPDEHEAHQARLAARAGRKPPETGPGPETSRKGA